VVEGNGLENRRASNGTEGSNPSLSAKQKDVFMDVFLLGGWPLELPREYLSDSLLYGFTKIVRVFDHGQPMGFDDCLVARVG
jgi:hypothetical protein